MLVFCLVAVPCLLIIPLVLAYFINMQPPGYKLFRAVLYLPSVLSITVIGIIFSCLFQGDEYGLINAWFGTNIQWLSGQPFEGDILRWVVILLVSIWWQTGKNFIILASALRNIPKSLYEACEMDGGNRWQLICRVTLPNIKPSLNLCLFTTLIAYLNLFGQPYVLYDAANQNTLVSPMLFIRYYLEDITYASQTGYICACAIVFGLFVMLFSIIQQGITSDRKRTKKRGTEYSLYTGNRKFLQEYSEVNS
jgi:multiple sugar transport system permease protein